MMVPLRTGPLKSSFIQHELRCFARTSAAPKVSKEEENMKDAAKRSMTRKDYQKRTSILRKSFAVSKRISFSRFMLPLSGGELNERRKFLKDKFGLTVEEQRYISR